MADFLSPKCWQSSKRLVGSISQREEKTFWDIHFSSCGLSGAIGGKEPPTEVVAEGIQRPSWEKSMNVVFRMFIKKYDECRRKLTEIMREIATSSSAYFVLSFQYEGVYAYRDAEGLHEVRDPDRTMDSPISDALWLPTQQARGRR